MTSRVAYLSPLLSDEVVDCVDPNCSKHQHLINNLATKLVECLLLSAENTIPMSGERRAQRPLAGWNEFVRPLKEQSDLWYRIWKEAGYPSSGVLFQIKKRAKRRYKYKVRRIQRRQEYLMRKRMAEALLADHTSEFWSEVRRTCGSKRAASVQVIDGCSIRSQK